MDLEDEWPTHNQEVPRTRAVPAAGGAAARRAFDIHIGMYV
jgi:hypothetical protein